MPHGASVAFSPDRVQSTHGRISFASFLTAISPLTTSIAPATASWGSTTSTTLSFLCYSYTATAYGKSSSLNLLVGLKLRVGLVVNASGTPATSYNTLLFVVNRPHTGGFKR